jgi:hypothetical protein
LVRLAPSLSCPRTELSWQKIDAAIQAVETKARAADLRFFEVIKSFRAGH